GPTRSAPPASRRTSEPPPAPTVCTSTDGNLTGTPPTSRSGTRTACPPGRRQTSVDVPPMSNAIASVKPARRARRPAPTTPPAGPETSSRAGCAAASSAGRTPPDESITTGSGNPASAAAATLEERVRGDGRPMREARQPGARSHRARGGEHRFLLPRGGRHLGRPDPPLLDEHCVGERATDVDAQDRHVRTLHRHASPRLP